MYIVNIFLLIISSFLGFFLATYIARHRRAPGALPLSILILGASLWSLGFTFELLAASLRFKLLWEGFEYFGIIIIPLAWFAFVTQYLGNPPWMRRILEQRLLLMVIPAVSLLLVWTNPYHNLMWKIAEGQVVSRFESLVLLHGPWFWVLTVYSYTILLLGSMKLAASLFHIARLQRWQSILALVAILLPWLGNSLYLIGISPQYLIDWTSFVFLSSGVLFSISLFRFKLANIVPIAQETVFAGLKDRVWVLDLNDFIVDMNQSARNLTNHPGRDDMGKNIAQVVPELAIHLHQAGYEKEYEAEITLLEAHEQQVYDLHISLLTDSSKLPIGRVVVLHQITQYKRDQAELEKARDHLEIVVSQRTEMLRQAFGQIQNELEQRTLAEKRFKDVIESAPDAMFLLDADGNILLVNATAERMFDYSRQDLMGKKWVESLIPARHRSLVVGFCQQFLEDTRMSQSSFGLDLYARRKDGSEFPMELGLSRLATADSYWMAINLHDITERLQAERAQSQLLVEIKQSNEQLLKLALRLQEVQEFERQEIAVELHDRVGQNLTGINLNLKILQNQLQLESSLEVNKRLSESLQLVEETTQKIRGVMADLYPPVLDEYGLAAAIKWYSGDFTNRTGIKTHVHEEKIEPRLALVVEKILYRLVQESLNNVAKHAQATHVVISLQADEEMAYLRVKDNGVGFDPQSIEDSHAHPHWGFLSMQQRAASIRAELAIDAAPGKGTQVLVRVRRNNHDD